LGEAALMMPFVIYCLLRGPLPFRFTGEDTPNLLKSVRYFVSLLSFLPKQAFLTLCLVGFNDIDMEINDK
jgi:hypothetical protein